MSISRQLLHADSTQESPATTYRLDTKSGTSIGILGIRETPGCLSKLKSVLATYYLIFGSLSGAHLTAKSNKFYPFSIIIYSTSQFSSTALIKSHDLTVNYFSAKSAVGRRSTPDRMILIHRTNKMDTDLLNQSGRATMKLYITSNKVHSILSLSAIPSQNTFKIVCNKLICSSVSSS